MRLVLFLYLVLQENIYLSIKAHLISAWEQMLELFDKVVHHLVTVFTLTLSCD